jgi:hypothetical protein
VVIVAEGGGDVGGGVKELLLSPLLIAVDD